MGKQQNINKAVIRIHMPEAVLKKARQAAKDHYPDETYGVFLGYIEENDIYVTDLVMPPDKDVWRSHTKVQVTARWLAYVQENHEDSIVGDFHSHPYDKDAGEINGPYPSEADITHSVQFQQVYCPEYVFYIIFAVCKSKGRFHSTYEHYLLAKEPELHIEKTDYGV